MIKIKKSLSFKQKQFNDEEISLSKHLFGISPSDVYFNFECDIDLDLTKNFINVYGLSGEGKTLLKDVIKENLSVSYIDYDDIQISNIKISELFDLVNHKDFIIRLFYSFGMFEMRNIFEYYDNLSNGQKLRINYIKILYDAYINKTKVILIDEFLTFVDSLSAKVFVNSIRKFILNFMPEVTIITFGCNDNILHYFEDGIITMQNGKILNQEIFF